MQILLVEDNISIAKGLIYSLEQKEYKVSHTDTIERTILALESKKIDLIILDISLPDGDGFRLYEKEIKKRKITFFKIKENNDIRQNKKSQDEFHYYHLKSTSSLYAPFP